MFQKAHFTILLHWLGFAGIIGLYFFIIRPIRVGFISILIEYVEPAIIAAKGVELKQAATTVIFSFSSQDAPPSKNSPMDLVSIPFSYSPHSVYGP